MLPIIVRAFVYVGSQSSQIKARMSEAARSICITRESERFEEPKIDNGRAEHARTLQAAYLLRDLPRMREIIPLTQPSGIIGRNRSASAAFVFGIAPSQCCA